MHSPRYSGVSSSVRMERQAAYSGVWKMRVRSRRVGQFAPAGHLHDAGSGAGEERCVRRRGDLRHVGQQLHVFRVVVELVVADQHAERLAAELAELLLVDLAEDRALIPGSAAEFAQGARQFALADIEQADFQHGVRIGRPHQEVQAAPSRLRAPGSPRWWMIKRSWSLIRRSNSATSPSAVPVRARCPLKPAKSTESRDSVSTAATTQPGTASASTDELGLRRQALLQQQGEVEIQAPHSSTRSLRFRM